MTKVVDPRIEPAEVEGAAGAVSGPSLLELIEQDVARQQEKRLTTPPLERVGVLGKDGGAVPGREGWAFDFSTRMSQVDSATIEAESTQPDMPGGVDHVGKGINLAVRLCRGMVHNGVEVKDETGQRVTFTSPSLQRIVGAENARDCVAKVWVDETGATDEAGLAFLGQELVVATGWAQRARPTKRA